MKLTSVILLSTMFLTIGCDQDLVIDPEQDDISVNVAYSNVDQRLWIYFQSFEQEAQERGLFFVLKDLNIQGLIEHIDEASVAGHCKYGSHIDNEVTIDSGFWSRSNNTLREFVVFHELGHCVLLRDHDESVLSNGTCESLMRSGVQDCRDNYNTATRDRYLDELFSENNS